MNKNDVYISVLIPVFNVQLYLRDCIDSVLSQNTEVSYEIVLVNDGSTDDCPGICDEYREKYPDKIKVIHKENGGLISARREALKFANGKFVVWLDSDDMISDGYFDEIKKIDDENHADMIIFNFCKIKDRGIRLHRKYKQVFREGPVSKDEIFSKLISGTSLNQMCRKVCRRDLYDVDADYSMYYRIQNGEDLIQSMPVVCASESFYYSEKAFYNYRINYSSLSRKPRKDRYKSLGVVRSVLYDYMERAGYCTQTNIKIFYGYYLKCIFNNLVSYVNAAEKNVDSSVFEEIYKFRHVALAEKYLNETGQKRVARRALSLFYLKDWDKLVVYLNRVVFFDNTKKRLKALIVNCYGK